ncbi:serine/threonine-protein kinase S6KL [Chironomus tepperi]|uniref:serine/threonine-protein kinase S6KL n=1 Tax=Chironomus tepperi TaxID=113505 RepID=UPI00391F22E7
MDGVDNVSDSVKRVENQKVDENQILCGPHTLRQFYTKIRRHSLKEDTDNNNSSFGIERKFSSNWTYKLKDEKSSIKTLWPVCCREYLFLPEFKVHNEELKTKYEIIDFIASGSFGKVYKVRQQNTNDIFALKILEKSKIILDNYVNQLKDEVSVKQAISHHPFIVTSQEHWQNKGYIFQLTEYISEGELFNKIKHFTRKLVQIYVAELAIVIEFLHNAGIIYRDLKSENILLDENYHIKLIDFGLSKWLKQGQRTFTICGTKNSMAPEIFTGNGYDHAVDWYSLGILAMRMFNNNQCHKHPDNEKIFENFDEPDDARTTIEQNESPIIRHTSMYGENIDAPSKDLLNRLLEKDPKYRLKSIMNLRRIAFYHNFNFDDIRNRKISPRKLIEDDKQMP